MATTKYKFKKKTGTSGINGHLYETKLVSFILFNLLHDVDIEEFYLASNMDEIGSFDDICLKATIKGINKPILVFLQAKHKDGSKTNLSYDLIKNFHTSWAQVKEQFKCYKNKDNNTQIKKNVKPTKKNNIQTENKNKQIKNNNIPTKNVNIQNHDDNILFKDNFDDIECLFILYTNGNYFGVSQPESGELSNTKVYYSGRVYDNKYAKKLNDLIVSNIGSHGYYLKCTDEEVEYINKKILEEEIITVAEHFSKFLNDNDRQSMNIMHDECMLRYHVILRQCVLDVSEIQPSVPQLQNQELEKQQTVEQQKLGKQQTVQQPDQEVNKQKTAQQQNQELDKQKTVQNTTEKWRYAKFKPIFFETDDYFLKLFRNTIYEFLTKNRGNTKNVKKSTENIPKVNMDDLILSFLMEPSAINLSYVIDNYIIYTDNKLKFLVDRPIADQKQLDLIEISLTTVDVAQEIKFLRHLKLKVPVSFGNMDLTLKGNQKKIDKRLGQLNTFLYNLCQKSESQDSYEVITIGEDIDEDYLSATGGIGGAVGNLIVYDSATKLMKFTVDSTSLQQNAKSLFNQLNDKIQNLSAYRIKIRNIRFPKLVFDCTDEAKAILNKLLVYEKQRNHSGVEELLIENIKKQDKNNTTQTLPIKSETISVYFHHEIQQWWLYSTLYFTKSSNIFEKAIKNIITEPQMCALQTTYFINSQNRIYVFNKDATNSFNAIDIFSNIIIVTDVASLMVMKIIQCLRNKDMHEYTVLDLKYMINLPIKEFRSLESELIGTEKIIIIVCSGVENGAAFYKRLLTIANAVEEKNIIIVASKDFITTTDANELKEYFAQINNVFEDEKVTLTDFDRPSQNDLTENAKVLFQGHETCLKTIIEAESLGFVKGLVLTKIIRNETIVIGDLLSDSKYEEIKYLYVDRRLRSTQKSNLDIYVRTFNDIEQNHVLITAEPGMGKSILLTNLSLKTKENDNVWIFRINLLDHSKEFHDWQNSKRIMNKMEVINFLCRVVAKNKNITISLKEMNNKIYLQDCTDDELITFELNIFLQYFNTEKLLLLFDGFDEICPHYKNNVLKLLTVVMNFPQNIKMWVTSRPYNEILPDLERVLGKAYKMQYITEREQENYLNNIWSSKLDVEKLNEIQLSNLISFAEFILDKILTKTFPVSMHFTFRRMYYLFYDFVEKLVSNDAIVLAEDLTMESAPSTSTSEENKSFNLGDQLVGTPLLLFLVAEYFVNITTNKIKEWELDINIIKIYESFIESKLKNMLFEEKNKIDIYKPDVMTRYEKDRAECIDMHKKLAAYAVLKNKIFHDVCPLDEFKDMLPFNDELEYETLINTIKSGKEKTGLINHVTLDDIPVFIHKTFGEYFASEFLCDIFKSNIEFDNKKVLYTAIYTYGSMDIRPWLNEKRWIDVELNDVIKNILSKKLVVLSWHREFFSRGNWGIERLLKLLSSCPEDYEVDWCSNTTEDFAETLNVLSPQERRREIRRFQRYVISIMKPHLKHHFTGTPVLRGDRQMINWMNVKINLF